MDIHEYVMSLLKVSAYFLHIEITSNLFPYLYIVVLLSNFNLNETFVLIPPPTPFSNEHVYYSI